MDYPLPWKLEKWPDRKNPYLIAANNKLIVQVEQEAGEMILRAVNLPQQPTEPCPSCRCQNECQCFG